MKLKNYIPALIFMFIFVIVRSAAAIDEPSIISGTKALLQTAFKWLLVLIPVAAGSVIGWHTFLRQLTEGDPYEVARHNKAMKNALTGAAISWLASVIVVAFLSF